MDIEIETPYTIYEIPKGLKLDEYRIILNDIIREFGGTTREFYKAVGLTTKNKKGWRAKLHKNWSRGQTPKASKKSFYSSWEWKELRFATLKRYGAICMLCKSDKNIVVDHILPRSKFPHLELDRGNTQVLCNDCNMGKSNKDYTDFRP